MPRFYVKVAQDLEETDKKRKQMFKQYEMQKHFEREASLVNMTEEEKKKYLHEEEEAKKKEEEAKKRVRIQFGITEILLTKNIKTSPLGVIYFRRNKFNSNLD